MNRPNAEAVAEQFAKDTEGFVLIVLHEEGEYRHLRFQKPAERWGSTDIHTWPGGVVTSGDMADGWMFQRGLGFFANRVNLSYWEEKLARSCRATAKEFSEVTLRAELASAVMDFDVPESLRDELDDDVAHLIDSILAEHAGTNAALEQISDFTFEKECPDCLESVNISFGDPYELDVEDYTWHFVWAAHVLHTAASWLAAGDARVIGSEVTVEAA